MRGSTTGSFLGRQAAAGGADRPPRRDREVALAAAGTLRRPALTSRLHGKGTPDGRFAGAARWGALSCRSTDCSLLLIYGQLLPMLDASVQTLAPSTESESGDRRVERGAIASTCESRWARARAHWLTSWPTGRILSRAQRAKSQFERQSCRTSRRRRERAASDCSLSAGGAMRLPQMVRIRTNSALTAEFDFAARRSDAHRERPGTSLPGGCAGTCWSFHEEVTDAIACHENCARSLLLAVAFSAAAGRLRGRGKTGSRSTPGADKTGHWSVPAALAEERRSSAAEERGGDRARRRDRSHPASRGYRRAGKRRDRRVGADRGSRRLALAGRARARRRQCARRVGRRGPGRDSPRAPASPRTNRTREGPRRAPIRRPNRKR